MKRIVWVLPVILGMFFLAACSAPSPADDRVTAEAEATATGTPAQQSTNAPLPAASTESSPLPASESVRVVLLPNAQDEQKTDVLLRNTQTGAESLFLTLEQVYREHYHAAEFTNQGLYIIKRIGDVNSADGDWTDELWHYDRQGRGEKLFAGTGLDFRVTPNGQMIALQYAAGFDLMLVFLKSPSEVVQEIDLSQLDETNANYPSPETWNAQSSQFWGALRTGSKITAYFRIDTDTWEITKFDVSSLPINTSGECALNGDTGKLAFSDYPAIFDAVSHQQFVDSQKPVSLFLFDLNSQVSQTIATSQAKEFKPAWLDDNTVEFNKPDSSGRLTYRLP